MENARNDFQNQPNLENYAAVQQFDPRGLSLLHSPSIIISDLLGLSESQSSSSSSSYCPSENKQNAFFRFEQNPLQLSSSFRLSGSNEQLSQNGFGSCGTSTGSGSPPFEAISEPTSEQLALLSVEALQGPSGVQAPPIHNRNYQEARYKTELCLHHRESNNCPHGDRCLFAHGLQELRPYRGRHPKHKTQNCKAFHETGYCNYGYRCSYIHLESNETIQYIRQLNEVAQNRRRSQLERSFTFKKSPKRHQLNH